MTEKLSKESRDHLKHLVKETILWNYSTAESLHYIDRKLGISISERYYFNVKQKIVEENNNKLQYYEDNKGTIFLDEYMKRIQEIQYYQKNMWQLHVKSENSPKIQLDCMQQLHQLTVTLAGLYADLPKVMGFSKDLQDEVDSKNAILRRNNRIEWTEAEKEAFAEVERRRQWDAEHSKEAKF
jgi:hypothetical protein